ncbi:hypothetical protein KY284_004033 [Solanum tuberosum]|nr:hypothetical protein KY284_004033 [Solanum tuberosum]
MKNCTKSIKTMNFFFDVRSPKVFLPRLLLLLHPTNLVIQTIATIVAPTITMVPTNNGGPTIASLHPIRGDLQPTTTIIMVYAASCATNLVILQTFVDFSLIIILRPRLTMCQA